MTTETKKKIFAASKIGYGAFRCTSAVALACGHGLLAMLAKKPITRIQIANVMLREGQKTIKEGMADWERLK